MHACACGRRLPEASLSAGYRYGFYATPWPPLVILAVMEIIAAISVLTK